MSCLLLLSGLATVHAQPASARYRQVFHDSAFSTVKIVRDTDGGYDREEQITKTVSYHTIHEWSGDEVQRIQTYLIKEVSTQRSATTMEGEQGSIELVASSSDDNFKQPIWKKSIEANHIDYGSDYLQAVQYGCCGAEHGYMLYRYSDGKKLMNLSSELATVSIPNQRTKRYIGILSRQAALPQPDFDSDKAYFGLLTYIDPTTMRRQQVVIEDAHGGDSTASTEIWFDSISFTPRAARDRDNYHKKNELELWSADEKKDPNGYDNFTINITLAWDDEPNTIRIPVVHDTLMISGVHSNTVRLKMR
ncbi:MAG: hypothetical protein JSS75_14555 [Bacteroidetes bacterium]|nr:hypothetical protein [Bacteroidota bacterium]